jgi:hypothetical protein
MRVLLRSIQKTSQRGASNPKLFFRLKSQVNEMTLQSGHWLGGAAVEKQIARVCYNFSFRQRISRCEMGPARSR